MINTHISLTAKQDFEIVIDSDTTYNVKKGETFEAMHIKGLITFTVFVSGSERMIIDKVSSIKEFFNII